MLDIALWHYHGERECTFVLIGDRARGLRDRSRMGGSVKDVKSKGEVDEVVRSGSPVILHFWASWCEASKHMDQLFSHLSTDFPNAHFLRVEAEEQPEISEAYFVSAVPFFAFCKDGKTFDTLEGADPSSLANKVAKVAGSIDPGKAASPASLGMAAGAAVLEAVKELAKENDSSKEKSQVQPGLSGLLRKRLQELVNSHPIMLFMKGTPEEPKCGFSRKVVDVLKEEKVRFGSFDILSDLEVRDGLKKFSNWPTFPQLYCKGELLGGCDIAIAMHESGELQEVFKDHGIDIIDELKEKESGDGKGGITNSTDLSTTLSSRLESLINSSAVVLFMKGKPDVPKCGFSRKVVEILQQENVHFESFDILSDEEVRQGLKVYSNWSSYPQLYIKGELIGGSDIVLEMQKSGELQKILHEKGILPAETIQDRLKKLIASSPVMLFMKGTPDAPRCGFSSKVVDALRQEGVSFGSFDILSDEEVRQGLKVFSNWPTYPQLYYKSELIGGSDIVLELRNNGELKSTLSE
ncbi:Monothiol glutaredoxin-S17, partial [Mucuna pruriens]